MWPPTNLYFQLVKKLLAERLHHSLGSGEAKVMKGCVSSPLGSGVSNCAFQEKRQPLPIAAGKKFPCCCLEEQPRKLLVPPVAA